MANVKIPKALRGRLQETAKKHGFASAEAFADHLIEKGMKVHQVPDPAAPLDRQLQFVVDERGYSSKEEVIEHLLERGLKAYDTTDVDPEALKARLRGLGYIE